MKYIKTFESFLNENYLFEAKDPAESPVKGLKSKKSLAYFAKSGLQNFPGKENVEPAANILGVDKSEIFYNNLSNPVMLKIAETLQDEAKFTKATGMKLPSSTAGAKFTFKAGNYNGIKFIAEFTKYPDDDEATISFIWMSMSAAEELAKEF